MLPWKNGIHASHSAFVIQVQVCKDQEGRTHSCFELPTPDDEATAMAMSPSHGMMEGMCALLTQALVLETKLQVLEKLSGSGISMIDFSSEEVTRTVCDTFHKSLEELAPALVQEVLERLLRDFQSGDPS